MIGYTHDQILSLQNYIDNAKIELTSGHTQEAINNILLYYNAQTDFRSYAGLAISVINNTELFGKTANQNIIDAIGLDEYNQKRGPLIVALATADMALIAAAPDQLPTANQEATYHYLQFAALGIPVTAWGGAAAAAMGLDWSNGNLAPEEQSNNLADNLYASSLTPSDVAAALGSLEWAGIQSIFQGNIEQSASSIIGFESQVLYFTNAYLPAHQYTGSSFGFAAGIDDSGNFVFSLPSQDYSGSQVQINSEINQSGLPISLNLSWLDGSFTQAAFSNDTTGPSVQLQIGNASSAIDLTELFNNDGTETINFGQTSITVPSISSGAPAYLGQGAWSITQGSLQSGTAFQLYIDPSILIGGFQNQPEIQLIPTSEDQHASIEVPSGAIVSLHEDGTVEYEMDNSTLSVPVGLKVEIIGTGNSILASTGDDISIQGGGNTIQAQSGDRIELSGTEGNTDAVIATGDTYGTTLADGTLTGIFLDDNSQADVSGNNDGVIEGNGVSLVVTGGGNSITMGTSDATEIAGTGGIYDNVFASAGTTGTTANGLTSQIWMDDNTQADISASGATIEQGDGASLNTSGGGNSITMGTNDALGVSGTGGVYDNIFASAGTAGFTADGLASQIVLGDNSQAYVSSTGAQIEEGNGVSLDTSGGGNVITMAQNDSTGISGTSGAYDTIYAYGGTTGVSADGHASQIVVGDNSQVDITANNARIAEGDGVSVNADGGGNVISTANNDATTITDTYGNYDTLYAYDGSSGVTADGKTSQITLGDDTQANVSGSNAVIEGDDNATLNASGFGNVIHASENNTITENNATISVAAGDHVTIIGSGDTIIANGNDDITVEGGGNAIQAGAGDRIEISGTYGNADSVSAAGDSYGSAMTDGALTGIFIDDDVQADINGNNNGIVVGDRVSLNAAGGGDLITLGAGDAAQISETAGVYDNIFAPEGTAGQTADGLISQILLGDNSQANVSTSGANIGAGNGVSLNAIGGSNSITMEYNDSIGVSGTNGDYDNVFAYDGTGGSTANGMSSQILIGDNSQAYLAANDAQIAEGNGASLYATGGGNIISMGYSDSTGIGGTGGNYDTIYAYDGTGGTTANGLASQISIGDNSQANFVGNGAQIGEGNFASLNADGGGNSISMGQGDATTIAETYGSYDNIFSYAGTGGFTADGQISQISLLDDAQANVSGSNTTINEGNGVSLNASGVGNVIVAAESDVITESNAVINVSEGDHVTIIGSGDTIIASGDDDIIVEGGGNAIQAGSGDRIEIRGTDGNADSVSASGDSYGASMADANLTGIFIDSDAQANVSGSNNGIVEEDRVTLNSDGGGNSIIMGYSDSTGVAGTDGSYDNIFAYNGTIGSTANGLASQIVLGTNTQAYVSANGASIAEANGVSVSASGGGNIISMQYNDATSISSTNGIYDTIYAYAGTSGVAANGQTSQIQVGDNSEATVVADDADIYEGNGDSLNASGGGNTISTQYNDATEISGTYGSYDTIYSYDGTAGAAADGRTSEISIDNNTQANITANGGIILESLGDTINTDGGGNTIYAGYGDLTKINDTFGNYDSIYATNDGVGGVTAEGEGAGIWFADNTQAYFSGNNGQIWENTGDTVNTSGGGNVISAGLNDLTRITNTNGNADNISAYNDGNGVTADNQTSEIWFDNNSQANISGNGNSIVENSGDTLGVYGSTNTISNIGAGDETWVGNTNGGVDNLYATGAAFGGTTANGQPTGIYLDRDTQVTVAGSNNGLSFSSGDEIGVQGDFNVLNGGAGNVVGIIGNFNITDAIYSNVIVWSGVDDGLFGQGNDFFGVDEGDVYDPYDGDGGYGDYGDFGGYDGGDFGDFGGFGGYGFASLKALSSTDIGAIAAADLAARNPTAAVAAEAARLQAMTAANSPVLAGLSAAAFEGPKWTSLTATPTITWSLSVPSGGEGGQLEGEIQQAFATWGQASGLQFKEVAGETSADIQVGWKDFDTAATGELGYTEFSAERGSIQHGARIFLEDPAQDALIVDANGRYAYGDTQAEFEQMALHEIGHALGLADSSDSGSIMAPVMTGANETLDATDIDAIQALYGITSPAAGASTSDWSDLTAQSARLIEAMAGFRPTTGPISSIPAPANDTNIPVQLAASH
ncbi:matrixin family metalloprotease [Roseixanthobacter pseudopolyaromaticivorans]|uniref:matrixin family metalloprotease n=1 Tax=Xanthobacteraceae TaxID=335928 RepID=UPI00372B64F3